MSIPFLLDITPDYLFVNYLMDFITLPILLTLFFAWASAGEGKRGPLHHHPLPTKIVCFSNFLKENSVFLGVLGGKYYAFAPLENFALPCKKVCRHPLFFGYSSVTSTS
jgi:hypothetical protein